MSKIIGLIACSSRKLGQDNLAEKYLAKDIYKGNTFIKSKEEGLKKYKCEEWYILSGKYGLLDKNERISYYNLYLGKQSAEYKKKWAENVLNTLKSKYDLKNDIFYIFGGKSYYEHLIPHLHCIVFAYKNSNCIDLNKPTEYRNGDVYDSKSDRIKR